MFLFFFFSSRRRHTRLQGDWSSDVCSSDLYPGAEPGGGGYVAQRMLAAPTERDAMRTTLLFNVLHYAVRPWPWIIVALASLIVYPDLASIAARFPHIDRAIVRNDLAYSAMLVY